MRSVLSFGMRRGMSMTMPRTIAPPAASSLMFATPSRMYAATPAGTALAQACQKEIADEQALDRAAAPAVPPGWVVSHTPGTSYFTLERKGDNQLLQAYVALPKSDPTGGE